MVRLGSVADECTGRRIFTALYEILDKLGAGVHILGALGSLGDTLPDDEVADLLETEAVAMRRTHIS